MERTKLRVLIKSNFLKKKKTRYIKDYVISSTEATKHARRTIVLHIRILKIQYTVETVSILHCSVV